MATDKPDINITALIPMLDHVIYTRILGRLSPKVLDKMIDEATTRIITSAVERALTDMMGGYSYSPSFQSRIKERIERFFESKGSTTLDAYAENVAKTMLTPAKQKAIIATMEERLCKEVYGGLSYKMENAIWEAIQTSLVEMIKQNGELFTASALEKIKHLRMGK